MGLQKIEAWGGWCPWPADYDDEGPVVYLAPTPSTFRTPPKRTTTYRTCPQCGCRGTKILSLNAEDPDKPYECQSCGTNYDAPPINESTRRKRGRSRAWWLA